jgi:hypothetical protein
LVTLVRRRPEGLGSTNEGHLRGLDEHAQTKEQHYQLLISTITAAFVAATAIVKSAPLQ